MNFSKILTTSGIIVATGLILTATTAHAKMYGSPNCNPLYGGGETCIQEGKLILDKKVLNPKSVDTKGGQIEEFVDNLSINDPKYKPEQTIRFQLVVTNTGTAALTNIKIEDTMPDYVTDVSGEGTFNKTTKVYTQTIDKLDANTSRTIIITAKVAPEAQLPKNDGVVCVINHATAKTSNDLTEDNSQFCIEKTLLPKKDLPELKDTKVYPAPVTKKTPPTGPEAFALIPVIGGAISGVLLRRKTKNL